MASPGEQDAHTRHDGTAWRHQSAGRCIAGTVKAARPERSQQALQLTSDTSRQARNRVAGSAELTASFRG